MGKGQQNRRQAEKEAAAAALAAAASGKTPEIGMLRGLPPAPRAAGFTVKAEKKQSTLETSQGMDNFLVSDKTSRLDAVNQLLTSSSGTSSNASLKSSRSMQSLTDALASVKMSGNSGKTMKGSNSFEDLGSMGDKNEDNGNDRAADLTAIVKRCKITSTEGARIVTAMSEQVRAGSESGLVLLNSLMKALGKTMEPFVVPLLPKLLALGNDRSATIRDLSSEIVVSVGETICPYAFRLCFLQILTPLLAVEVDWKIKVAGLKMLRALAPRASSQLSPLLPQIIPLLSDCVIDPKKQVQVVALETLNIACKGISNEDIAPIVPQLVSVIANPDESAKTIDALLETTFVANVDAATLALIAPLLGKAMRGRSSGLKRKAARIIDNMCRLCSEPSDVAPFVPLLLPQLDRIVDEVSDIEVAEVAKAARTVLINAMGEGNIEKVGKTYSPVPIVSTTTALEQENVYTQMLGLISPLVQENMDSESVSTEVSTVYSMLSEYMAQMTSFMLVYDTPLHAQHMEAHLGNAYNYAAAMSTFASFKECCVPFLKPIVASSTTNGFDGISSAVPFKADGSIDEALYEDNLSELAEQLCKRVRMAALGDVPDVEAVEDFDSANVCNIDFSLAFGGKILLHNTKLKLGRGRRYGLMGKNGAGKTTLLTNIATHNIEGFPEELRTVYVQHDDSAMGVTEQGLLEELMEQKEIIEVGVQLEEARAAFLEINFTPLMLDSPRHALSGGWKMKYMIIRAMLLKADIMLLDEPTNHLDAASVSWLANYLNTLNDVTCLLVSHDTEFLDNVVTDIIHYETRKLVYYKGSLKDFVKIHPEAKYYYDLQASDMKFVFPTPDRLEGISSTSRTVLKLENVSYTYPGRDAPTIKNASVRICLGSRVAVIGPNGAGKSTLIKMLVQETQPDGVGSNNVVNPSGQVGEFWKHHNLRIAYVAQHSFHHIEKHLDVSPVDYFKWRFDGGVDHEDMHKNDNEEEETPKDVAPKKYGDVKEVLGRRKNGHTLEYECSWIGQSMQEQTIQMKRRGIAPQMEPNKYIPLDEMIALGHAELVRQADAKIAARAAGLDLRPLVTREIQGHLDDFNLEAEFGTHGNIRRLSGGQKVKLVLAAAMWNRPHLLILDEPTNYLDREALAALTQAIKAFHGGIVIISHHAAFLDALCTERWMVNNGEVKVEGDVAEAGVVYTSTRKNKEKSEEQEKEKLEITGAKSGNVNKTKEEVERVRNPRSFEYLSKVEVRKFSKLARIAGKTLAEYVGSIQKGSAEWNMLSTTVNC